MGRQDAAAGNGGSAPGDAGRSVSAKILLVGAGKMGAALLKGWLDTGISCADIAAVEPHEPTRIGAARRGIGVSVAPDALGLGYQPDVVVFAVKPQSMDAVVPAYAAYKRKGVVFLSIAAGKPISYFETKLGRDAAIVRAMPNTPAAVGRGFSVLTANRNVDVAGQGRAAELLAAVGEVAWVQDEALMDAVTATSGSGPAYVFYLIECLAKAGAVAGLPADLALRLARSTIAGAGELARLDPAPAAELRRNVTSPGGTTEAALKILMGEGGLETLMIRVVAAAADRSRELARG
ncbi:MAG: pyrroline-5-carboxylate reductase [Alphaproteobacteria bacterium]|nr:pyrroline-5-carboxylate reductase [Alphaproteobacteria bacterium]